MKIHLHASRSLHNSKHCSGLTLFSATYSLTLLYLSLSLPFLFILSSYSYSLFESILPTPVLSIFPNCQSIPPFTSCNCISVLDSKPMKHIPVSFMIVRHHKHPSWPSTECQQVHTFKHPLRYLHIHSFIFRKNIL